MKINIVERISNFNNKQKGTEFSSMLALRLLDVTRKACIARVAKIFDHSNLKILIPKQMLQR